MTIFATTPFFAEPRLDSRLVELPGAGEALTPEDKTMRTISELIQSGNLAAARRHPQYMSNVRRGERFISQAVADRRRREQLCQPCNIMSVMPSIGGAAVDDWQMQQMDALLGEKKRFEGVCT